MKIIFNNIIPLKGFKAMTIWPFIFARRCSGYNDITNNHEIIHALQQKETLLVPFFLWYVIEYSIRFVTYGFNQKMAYRNVSFEQEAYCNQTSFRYTIERKHFSWLQFVTKKTFR